MHAIRLLCVILSASMSRAAQAQPVASLRELNPFVGLGESSLGAFTGANLALQLTGLAAAPALVLSGADTRAHNFFAEQTALAPYGTPAVYGIYVLPVALGGSLLAYGLGADSPRALAASSAVLQASLLVVAYQSVLKALTGRPPPDPGHHADDDASRTFRFGFLRGGVHYGWPSGHLMTTTALVASLLPVFDDSTALRLGGGVLVAYVGASVATHEGSSMHWLSDMVTGVLAGYAIGSSVGRSFARRLGVQGEEGRGVAVGPMLGEARGVTVTVALP